MNLGVIQGRLTLPINNKIQEFPKKLWEKEFSIIDNLGLNHIEWIITKNSFDDGVTNLDVKKYSKKISSICCDHIIDENIVNYEFIEKKLNPIISWCQKNDIESITIPLLDESKITDYNKNIIFDNFKKFSKKNKNINFNFEIESSIENCLELVESEKNLFLVYDTGNITSCGFNHDEWISKGFNYIRHVHLKDRIINTKQTVEPTTGDTNFKKIFDLLKEKNYNCFYTIQTCRGVSGEEIRTIKKHIEIFKKIYDT